MRRWRLHPADTALAAAVVGDVLSGVGTARLAASYLKAMQRVMPVTFCTVFSVSAAGRIETVSAASSYGSTAERTSERYVAQRFDQLDPNMAWLAARKLPKRPQLWLGHQRADEVADPAYRAACYGDVGIRERASVLLLLPTGQRVAVSFYRSLAQPGSMRPISRASRRTPPCWPTPPRRTAAARSRCARPSSRGWARGCWR